MMHKEGKDNPITEGNLIRLHPEYGGLTIDFGQQRFQGVSVDLFFGLDLSDFSQPYWITRKFNMSISINPNCWSTKAFLSYLTEGDLKRTSKCELHGDEDTGLRARKRVLGWLNPMAFDVQGVRYVYESVGVACNHDYNPVSHRIGNDFENGSSHFEIKFRRQSDEGRPLEYLCLNIHLMKEVKKPFGQMEAIERLKRGIGLFYAELGLPGAEKYTACTALKSALTVTLDNYEARGFACKHEASLAVLSKHQETKKYTRVETKPVDGPVKEKSKLASGFFSFESSDFPPLSAIGNPKSNADKVGPIF